MGLVLHDFTMKFFTPSEFVSMVGEVFDTLILDLDNTIYDENVFLFDRYRAISSLVARGDVALAKNGFHYLSSSFLKTGRAELFESYLERFKLSRSHTVDELLTCMRLPPNNLIPFNYFEHLIQGFVGRLCLVTNGHPVQQNNKIFALGIANLFDDVVLADEVEKKPSPQALTPILGNGPLGRVAYVGDSDVDRVFAKNCNMSFIRIDFDRDTFGLAIQNTIRFQRFEAVEV
jgi:FMN phosphatase YigB (HAD superfamily)